MVTNPVVMASLRDGVVWALCQSSFAALIAPVVIAPIAIYDYWFNLEKLGVGNNYCMVRPRKKSQQLSSRNAPQEYECTIDIALQYKYAAPIACELDPYLAAVEQMGGLLMGQTLGVGSNNAIRATCIKLEFPQLFDEEQMKKLKVFTSIVSPVFTIFN